MVKSKKQIKNNIKIGVKVSAITSLVAGAIYTGIPRLSLNDVLSLACLSLALFLTIKFIAK